VIPLGPEYRQTKIRPCFTKHGSNQRDALPHSFDPTRSFTSAINNIKSYDEDDTRLSHYRPAYRSETEKNILEDLLSSVLSKFKKYHPSGNLKFYNLDIFQSLKLRTLMGKILPFSLKLNFTPNTLGCYGLNKPFRHEFFTGRYFAHFNALSIIPFLSHAKLPLKNQLKIVIS